VGRNAISWESRAERLWGSRLRFVWKATTSMIFAIGGSSSRYVTGCRKRVVTAECEAKPQRRFTMKHLLPALTWLAKTVFTELVRILLRLALRGDQVE